MTAASEYLWYIPNTAEARVAEMAKGSGTRWNDHRHGVAIGQQCLFDLQARGDVLDDNFYTAPGKFGGGGAGTTWPVGSAEEVARSAQVSRHRHHQVHPVRHALSSRDRAAGPHPVTVAGQRLGRRLSYDREIP